MIFTYGEHLSHCQNTDEDLKTLSLCKLFRKDPHHHYNAGLRMATTAVERQALELEPKCRFLESDGMNAIFFNTNYTKPAAAILKPVVDSIINHSKKETMGRGALSAIVIKAAHSGVMPACLDKWFPIVPDGIYMQQDDLTWKQVPVATTGNLYFRSWSYLGRTVKNPPGPYKLNLTQVVHNNAAVVLLRDRPSS